MRYVLTLPYFFHQMFTLHSVQNNYYIPLIFALFLNKIVNTYTCKNIFKIINKKCNKLGLIFIPNLVVAYFEEAIHNGVYIFI